MEMCDICGKKFNGEAINNHGSYDYIVHTNFSDNIQTLINRGKENLKNKGIAEHLCEAILDESENSEMIDELLGCLKHYSGISEDEYKAVLLLAKKDNAK